MATSFSPCKGSYVLNQFPSNVMFGMNGFHVSASGAIQGHHGPLVYFLQWIGNTVLMKLAREIDTVNAGLRKIGCEDAEIGGIDLCSFQGLKNPLDCSYLQEASG